MSEQEYLYVSGVGAIDELAGLAADLLGLQVFAGQQGDEMQALGPAQDSDGSTTELWVGQNEGPVPGRHPDATAGYSLEVSVRVYGPAAVQRGEARRLFDGLLEARPAAPSLLTHEGVNVVVAYRPGAGVYEFEPGTVVNPVNFDSWARWVPRPAADPELRT